MLASVEARPRPGLTHADEVLQRFDEIDRRLQAAGFPATSPWWRKTVTRWYRSGRRQLVIRSGRRGGKSSTLSRLGVAEALYGHHKVPPGDTGVVAIISTRREEAAERIATVKAILDALGVAYRPWGELGVRLVGRRVGFRVYTASIAGVSGFTAIFVLCDEVAKWKDSETGVNPAGEVLRSVRPTMATQPEARIVLSSSPMGYLDAHADAFEAGETDLQLTAYAPTWDANPSLTEADTRILEPDESAWLREYKAIPQAEAESSLLSEVSVRCAMRHPPMLHLGDLPPVAGHHYVAAIDPATRTHSWALVVATKGPDGIRRVVLAREWRPKPGLPLSPRGVFAEIALLLRPYGLRWLVTDQHAVDALREPAHDVGLALMEEPWTPVTKRDAYEHVAKLLADEHLELPMDEQVAADLLGIRKRLTRVGVTYELIEAKGRHSDYAPALALAVVDARWKARAVDETKTEGEKAAARKRQFLEGREKERERAAKLGRRPVTHRMVPR